MKKYLKILTVMCAVMMIMCWPAWAAAEAGETISRASYIDLTPIINAAIMLIAAIVAKRLIPWIDARTTNEQKIMMRAAVRTLVFAAEQIYGAGGGADKMDFVVRQLEKQGYTADRYEIEAAVRECINNWPKLEEIKIETAAEIDVGEIEDEAE